MSALVHQLNEAAQWIRETFGRLSHRRDRGPIRDIAGFADFVATRSALIAQKKLYGYLKERIGMGYPKMFDDEIFARSIDIAKMQVFAASLADLTVHCVAHAAAGQSLDAQERTALARWCYAQGLAANAAQAPNETAISRWQAAFDDRVEATHWENIAAGASAFTESPKALIRWAPIDDEYKRYDREIVENSMRFAWNEIRTEFRERIDPAPLAGDWKVQSRAI